MLTLLVLFDLRPGVDPGLFERHLAEADLPALRRLDSVDDVTLLRAGGLLGSDAPPPARYVEIVEVRDLERLVKDLATPERQAEAEALSAFVTPPSYLVCERVD